MREMNTNATQVASAANLGKTAVRDIVAGKVKTPTVETMGKIAAVLECSISYLIGESDKPGGGFPGDISGLRPRLQPVHAELASNFVDPATAEDREEYLVYGTFIDNDVDLRLYKMRDDHADEIGIRAGDLITTMVSPTYKSANLADGILVVAKRIVQTRSQWEVCVREVATIEGKLNLVKRSSSDPNALAITRIEGGDNMYLTSDGELILVEGVVIRVTREFVKMV